MRARKIKLYAHTYRDITTSDPSVILRVCMGKLDKRLIIRDSYYYTVSSDDVEVLKSR